MDFGDLLRHLAESMGQGDDEDKSVYEPVGSLTDDEYEEWNAMHAESDRIRKSFEKLQFETAVLQERKRAWWFNTRRNHKILHINSLRIIENMIEQEVENEKGN